MSKANTAGSELKSLFGITIPLKNKKSDDNNNNSQLHPV